MNVQLFWGAFSLSLILLAGLLHCTRVWQGVITINPIGWFIWFVTSIAILVSYESVGAYYNLLPAIGNVIFPGVNFFLSLRQKIARLDQWDIACCFLGVTSIILWSYTYQDPSKAQYANYIAVVADLCALIPTYRLVKSDPMVEKPLAWILFSLGFGISIFAVTEFTVANFVLPIYMCMGSAVIAYVQIVHRKEHDINETWY